MGIILIQYVGYSDVSLAFNNLFFSTFSSILFIPLLLKLLVGKTIVIEIRPIIIQAALLVILPFLATRLTICFFQEKLLQGIRKASPFAVPILVFFTILITFGNASGGLKWDLRLFLLSLSTLGIYLLHAGLGFWTGNLIGGKELRNTLMFISSSRNCHFVLAIAVMNFPPLVTIPIIIASIFHHITNAFWLWVLRE
jgi:predicted Na+-dependent transporter